MAHRAVLFFDIDNCLYSKGKQVSDMMGDLIQKYFMTHLALTRADAEHLHRRYYKDYGLAIEGLVRHHKVDPLEYNAKVDDALPLENVLTRDDKLRQMLLDLDRSKVKPWLFTNAYVNHGKRVVKLLGIEDLFEGITYCDYGASEFLSKPNPKKFAQAMQDAGVSRPEDCYFVDDSALNCKAACALGWTVAHLVEPDGDAVAEPVANYQIQSIHELRQCFGQFFKSPASANGANGSV